MMNRAQMTKLRFVICALGSRRVSSLDKSRYGFLVLFFLKSTYKLPLAFYNVNRPFTMTTARFQQWPLIYEQLPPIYTKTDHLHYSPPFSGYLFSLDTCIDS